MSLPKTLNPSDTFSNRLCDENRDTRVVCMDGISGAMDDQLADEITRRYNAFEELKDAIIAVDKWANKYGHPEAIKEYPHSKVIVAVASALAAAKS